MNEHTALPPALRRGRPPRPCDSELKRWYEDGLSLEQVAEKAKMSRFGVRYRLIRAGCTLRPRSTGRRRLVVSLDTLAKLYFEEKKPLVQCAERLGISKSLASTILRNAGYRPRLSGPAPKSLPTDEIVRLYEDEKLATEKIAEQFHVSPWLIWKQLDAAGCKRRTHAENFTKNFIRRDASKPAGPGPRPGAKYKTETQKQYFVVGQQVESLIPDDQKQSKAAIVHARNTVARQLGYEPTVVAEYHRRFREANPRYAFPV